MTRRVTRRTRRREQIASDAVLVEVPKWLGLRSPRIAALVGTVGPASFALFGFIASLFTIGTVLWPLFDSAGQVDWGAAARYLIGLNLIALVGLSIVSSSLIHSIKKIRAFKKKEQRERDLFASIASRLEAISVKRCSGIEYFLNLVDTDISAKQAEDAAYADCVFIIDNVRQIFEEFTENACAVSIKLLHKSDEPDLAVSVEECEPTTASRSVYTFCRDSLSESERGRVDRELPEYQICKNTAFKTIIDPKKPDHFICNDLVGMGDEYENTAPEWWKYYNATAVVAIKKPHQIESDGTIGFLCVDNRYGKFDEEFTKSTLAEVGHSLYILFRLLFYVTKASQISRREIR